MFIVFEGIEGCGKSTQIKLAGEYLESLKIPFIGTREPGGTPVGEEIRKIFLHCDNRELTPLAELLLVNASRVQHVCQVIAPALKAGKVVLCDRFFDATVAYQGHAGGVPASLIYRCHELFLGSLNPDLTLLLDCTVEIGLERSRGRNKAEGMEREEGRFEDKQLKFHEKVRKGYLERAAQEPGRFRRIDAEKSVEKVQEEIRLALTEKLKGKGYAV